VISTIALALAMTTAAAAALGLFQDKSLMRSTSSGEVTLRIIVVNSDDEARHVAEQLRAGASFADLAKRVSIDATADTGGLVGRVSLAGLRPELQRTLRGVKVGQITPVIRVPTGYAILKVVPDSEAGNTAADLSPIPPALAARGSIKYVVAVGGSAEAFVSLTQLEKPADWNKDPRTICQTRRQSLAEGQAFLEEDLSPRHAARRFTQPLDVMQLHVSLGQLYAYHGVMARAIEEFEQARQIAVATMPPAALQLEETLGIAYLHKAEMANGLYNRPGDRDLLSANGFASLGYNSDSERAVRHFSTYLAAKPDELEVRWLLNLAYMRLGKYPDAVPRAQLIPPSVFASDDDVGRFVDVAPQVGLNSFAMAGGVIVDDFDNDGRFDVVTSSFNSCEPLHYFRRSVDGRFEERASKAGLGDQLGGLNIMQADYNNDGCLDILVLRGGWDLPQRKSLLRNNCDGAFTDVTVASGLAWPVTSTQAAVWVDVNNDGWLDLFVGSENAPAQLFLNKRDGTFEEVARRAGVDRKALSKGVAADDYDNDGWPDLYVSNLGGVNFLYHNNHDGTFTEVGRSAMVPGSGQGFATWFFDYDNDGWPDLFATSYFTSVDETVRTYLGLPNNASTLKLYQNRRDGSFRDVTRQVGLGKVFMPMGANFGDIDNDGFLDIFLGMGNPSYASTLPSVLLRNREGRSFVNVTTSSGTGELHKGHGVAFADLDNDGNEEIVFEVGGVTPADAHALRLFKNPGHDNAWVNLKLVGVKTNRGAVGARIKVTVEDADHEMHAFYRTVGSGGSFGASPLQQHVGLGRAARIVDLEVWWPTSDTRQHFTNVGTNQTLEIREFAETPVQLNRPRLPLGSGSQ
jgi:hypothetical protein